MQEDTIVAVATSAGRGGIGIVKISGSRAVSIAASLFRPKGGAKPEARPAGAVSSTAAGQFESHRFYYGHICDPTSKRFIDEVLLVVMRAPRTYTREDVAEIHAHGGPLALQTILNLIISHGARLAAPGEFTRRAFLNGRIDLTRAEAVMDLINARTERALQAAASQLGGTLQRQVGDIRNSLIGLLTRLEAAIDFPEDVEELPESAALSLEVDQNVRQPLKRLIRLYEESHILRDGLRVAVVGKPNAGKSSLLNRLVQKDRVIVTALPGTTRDVVEETVSLQGIPVTFCDTAGVHDTRDPVELMGMAKTREEIAGCDLVVFMVEAHLPLSADDLAIYRQVEKRPHIIAVNKIDLTDGKPDSRLLPEAWDGRPVMRISALRGDGIDTLKERIIALSAADRSLDIEPAVIPNLRQKLLLDGALGAVGELIQGIDSDTSPDLLALHVGEAIDRLGEIMGESVKADILERIFEQFCIGK